MKISLATADIPFKAYFNVLDCMVKGRIGRGDYVSKLEKKAADYFGAKHCIAVSSGTMADIIMLATLKEMYPGKDEVILPALTFIAQANAVLWSGLKPVFVDVKGYQLDWEKIETNERTLCIFPAHLIGQFSGWWTRNDIPIIEDCCEAMGGGRIGHVFGTVGVAGAFSMYPSHTITTGEGGLIITNDSEFERIARSIHNHGKIASDFDFQYVGINGKMTNLQAAIGCELIGKIEEVNERRKKNIDLYNNLFKKDFFASAPHCYPVIYKTKNERDHALDKLSEAGIEARKLMSCIPDTKPYKDRFGTDDSEKFQNARRLAECGLFLPVHQNLTESDIKRIYAVIPKP